MIDELDQEIIDAFMSITRSIGRGNSIDSNDIRNLTSKLKDFTVLSHGQHSISKALAEVFIDAYPMLEQYASRYESIDSTKMRLASDEIGGLIREILEN